MISLLTFCYLVVTVFADDEPSRSSYFINSENRRLTAQVTKILNKFEAVRIHFLSDVLPLLSSLLKLPNDETGMPLYLVHFHT